MRRHVHITIISRSRVALEKEHERYVVVWPLSDRYAPLPPKARAPLARGGTLADRSDRCPTLPRSPKARRKRAEDKVAQHRAALEQKKRAIMERLLTEEMAEVTTRHGDVGWKTVMRRMRSSARSWRRMGAAAHDGEEETRARWCGVVCVAWRWKRDNVIRMSRDGSCSHLPPSTHDVPSTADNIPLRSFAFHSIAFHCIPLHSIPLHSIAFHCIALH